MPAASKPAISAGGLGQMHVTMLALKGRLDSLTKVMIVKYMQQLAP